MPEPLTKLERRILDFLIDYLRRNTYQPSIREIGRRFDIKSTKTVSEYLQALADKGWIERDPSRSRGVKLLGVDLHPQTVTVPLHSLAGGDGSGRASGADSPGFELDRRLAGSGAAFCVRAPGDGFAAAGIRGGDLLLVEPVMREELEIGDVAVFSSGAEWGLFRCVGRDGVMAFEPDGPAGPPGAVAVEPLERRIVGRVTGVVRRLREPAPAFAATSHTGVQLPG